MQPINHPELEEAVLGAIMMSNESLLDVIDILDIDCFYNEANKTIYENAIIPLFNENKNIDLLTIKNKLDKEGLLKKVGGAYYISSLGSRVGSASNITEHSYILKEASIKRQLAVIGDKIYNNAHKPETDALELLDQSAKQIDGIGLKVVTQPFVRIDQIVSDNIKHIEKLSKSKKEITGIKSGYFELDKITCGWQNSDLIILAARPSMGKTTMALNLAENAAILDKKLVAFFSLEMSKEQVGNKLISSQTDIQLDNLRNGKMSEWDWKQLNEQTSALINSHILIDDQPAISVFEMKRNIRKKKHNNPDLALIIVDYLQLMTGEGQNREQEISYISRNLKEMAKEFKIPIIALSQLSRAVESRADKKPQLSDLRDSGAIEQDADIVIFLYRPEHYKIYEDSNKKDLHGKAKLLIAKHRNGAVGEVTLNFKPEVSRFVDEITI